MQAQTEVQVPRPSTLAYANLEAIWKLAGGAGGPRVQAALDTLGLTSITRVVSMSGLDDSGFVSRTRVFTTAPDRGLLKVLADNAAHGEGHRGYPPRCLDCAGPAAGPREGRAAGIGNHA